LGRGGYNLTHGSYPARATTLSPTLPRQGGGSKAKARIQRNFKQVLSLNRHNLFGLQALAPLRDHKSHALPLK